MVYSSFVTLVNSFTPDLESLIPGNEPANDPPVGLELPEPHKLLIDATIHLLVRRRDVVEHRLPTHHVRWGDSLSSSCLTKRTC